MMTKDQKLKFLFKKRTRMQMSSSDRLLRAILGLRNSKRNRDEKHPLRLRGKGTQHMVRPKFRFHESRNYLEDRRH